MSDQPMSAFQQLLEEGNYLHIPQVGDVVTGKVISNGRKEIRVDIDGYTTGVIRGRELSVTFLQVESPLKQKSWKPIKAV